MEPIMGVEYASVKSAIFLPDSGSEVEIYMTRL